MALAHWLVEHGRVDDGGQISLVMGQHSVAAGERAGRAALDLGPQNANDSRQRESTQYLTFNTPVESAAANQCGRVVFTDVHVVAGVGRQLAPGDAGFPMGCTAPLTLTAPGEGAGVHVLRPVVVRADRDRHADDAADSAAGHGADAAARPDAGAARAAAAPAAAAAARSRIVTERMTRRSPRRDTLLSDQMIEIAGGSAFTAARQQKKLTLVRRANPGVRALNADVRSLRRRRRQADRGRAQRARAPAAVRAAAVGDSAGRATVAFGRRLLVVPRLGTISPWSSKATDIAHICGLDAGARASSAASATSSPARSTTRRRCARALHDRMTESVLDRASRRRAAVRARARRARSRASRWAPSGARGARARQRDAGPGAVARRDRLPGRRATATLGRDPDRRRADDVRAGEQRALPPQDLQRRLRRSTARRSRSSLFQMIQRSTEASPGGVLSAYKRQRRGDRRARRRRASSPTRRPASTRAHARADAHPDEGRDPQPPDRDLAVPGRGHRLGRRDPRRGRDRARRASPRRG